MDDRYRMLIDGKWVEAESGQTFEVKNPATGEVLSRVPRGDREDARRALEAADKAFPAWRDTPAPQRASFMRKAADLVREKKDEIARTLTKEQGKPLNEAKGEVSSAAEALDYFAQEAHRILGDVIPTSSTKRKSVVIKQPAGGTSGCYWSLELPGKSPVLENRPRSHCWMHGSR